MYSRIFLVFPVLPVFFNLRFTEFERLFRAL